jgi:outer membrane protein OmpA-like peptidoglycan-associated protein
MMRKTMLLLAVAAVAGCGGISKEQYGAKQAEAAKYQKALQDETGKAAALEQQNAALKAQVDELSRKLADTSAAKSELEVTTARLAEQSSQLQGRQTLRLEEQLLFKEGSSALTPEAKRTLDSMAEAIRSVEDKSIIVAAYTDNKEAGGKEAQARRWQLSTARALTVAKYLAGRGLDPAKIAVAGFGEGRPVAPNDTLANRALNRRAELALTPANAQLKTIELTPPALKSK